MGPIGQMIARYLLERKAQIRIVAAVDVDPRKIGQDLGALCGLKKKLRIPVMARLADAPRGASAQVAILTTVSDLERAAPQIEELAAAGLHVVSTCEELSYPWVAAPALARRIDAVARRHKVTVLAAGVNPGFMMDLLPIALTAVCRRVDRIRISRIQDASIRRGPFQKKIGAGLTLAEFEARRRDGSLRHVGLAQSIAMIAARMGWKLTRIEDNLSPIVARRPLRTQSLRIARGRAAGVQQIGRGLAGKQELITLVFRAAIGEPDPRDAVEIFGEPSFVSTIPGGINGDIATCAIVLNAIPQVLRAGPGLKTMPDVPVAAWTGASRFLD
jgi:4-hydroxy-tetrahydrodipicolinate reductase